MVGGEVRGQIRGSAGRGDRGAAAKIIVVPRMAVSSSAGSRRKVRPRSPGRSDRRRRRPGGAAAPAHARPCSASDRLAAGNTAPKPDVLAFEPQAMVRLVPGARPQGEDGPMLEECVLQAEMELVGVVDPELVQLR